MIDSVTVRAPARLHLGFLDMNGELGRRFGSLGLAIDAYETHISVRRAAETSVCGMEAERARHVLTNLSGVLGIDSSFAVSIETAIPAHIGLGSGTQLALALAAALHHLSRRTGDLSQYAALTQRGARSSVKAAPDCWVAIRPCGPRTTSPNAATPRPPIPPTGSPAASKSRAGSPPPYGNAPRF